MTKQELSKRIEKEILLSYDEQLSIFNLKTKDAKELLLKYMKYGYLSNKAQLKIFDLPTEIAKELWKEYTSSHTLISSVAKAKAKKLGFK